MKAHTFWSVIWIAALAAACSSEAAQWNPSSSAQSQGEGRQEQIPALLSNATEILQHNPVPVLWPALLPTLKDPDQQLAVDAVPSTDGYDMLIYSTHDVFGKERSMSSTLATFSGKIVPDYRPVEEYVDGMMKLMNDRESITVDGTPMTYCKTETEYPVFGGDLVVWRYGNWLLTAQGEPNDIEQPLVQASEHTSVGLAREMLGLVKRVEGTEIKQGYISGQQAPRRTLTIEWTYDDRTWYSITSSDWEYAFQAINRLIRVK